MWSWGKHWGRVGRRKKLYVQIFTRRLTEWTESCAPARTRLNNQVGSAPFPPFLDWRQYGPIRGASADVHTLTKRWHFAQVNVQLTPDDAMVEAPGGRPDPVDNPAWSTRWIAASRTTTKQSPADDCRRKSNAARLCKSLPAGKERQWLNVTYSH